MAANDAPTCLFLDYKKQQATAEPKGYNDKLKPLLYCSSSFSIFLFSFFFFFFFLFHLLPIYFT